MYFAATESNISRNDFIRYHHLRSCIYFAVGTIESFLLSEMRKKLQATGVQEDMILRSLKKGKISETIGEWPKEIYGAASALPDTLVTRFKSYVEIRNEIAHPKNRDHEIYSILDKINALEITDTIGRILVSFYIFGGKAFPYWVLGWNYIGLGEDNLYPHLSNNMNGFYHSLRFMGVENLGRDLDFERRHLSSIDSYDFWRTLLRQYPWDIEPYSPLFPLKPRLTRRWFDRDFLASESASVKAKAAVGNPNNLYQGSEPRIVTESQDP